MTPPPLSPPGYHIHLARGGEVLHGYGIMQWCEDIQAGEDRLLPGTLYATLARMVDAGLIAEAPAPRGVESAGPPRRHYRDTARGRAAAEAETERMRRLVAIARRRAWLPGVAR
jgi:DNA-binding PadR family transcriptional regulator